MPRKVYKYLTVDNDDIPWIWTTADLVKTEGGLSWLPRRGELLDVGTRINPDLIPPALLEKAKTQIVKIEPIVIKEA